MIILAATLGPRALAGVDNDGPAGSQQAQESSAPEQSSDQGSAQADSSEGDDHDDGDSGGSPVGATKDPWASDQHNQQAQAAHADAQETERHLAQAPNQAQQQADGDCDGCPGIAGADSGDPPKLNPDWGKDHQEPRKDVEVEVARALEMSGEVETMPPMIKDIFLQQLNDLLKKGLAPGQEERVKTAKGRAEAAGAKDDRVQSQDAAEIQLQPQEPASPQKPAPAPANPGITPPAANDQPAEPATTADAGRSVADARELLRQMSHTGSPAAGGPFGDSTSTTPPLLADQPLPDTVTAAKAQELDDAMTTALKALGLGGLAIGGSVGGGVMMARVGASFCSREFDCAMFSTE